MLLLFALNNANGAWTISRTTGPASSRHEIRFYGIGTPHPCKSLDGLKLKVLNGNELIHGRKAS
jgi:hypothetical protein